jgi:hypothetical protein
MNYAFLHKAISEIKLMVETIQSMRLFKYRNVPFHSAVKKKKKTAYGILISYFIQEIMPAIFQRRHPWRIGG